MASDKSFIIIMAASQPNKLMPRYLQQLSLASIPHHVEPIQISSSSDGTVGWCISYWKKFAERFSGYDRLVLTDAWDFLCYGTREQIVEALPKFPIVVFGAERNLYPFEEGLAEKIGNWGTVWNYVNGGCLTASPSELLRWCQRVQSHPTYEPRMIGQHWFNRRWSEHSDLIHIDFHTRLFYCMFREHESPALVNEGGRPFNSVCKTFPPLIHFNGSYPWDEFLEMMERRQKQVIPALT